MRYANSSSAPLYTRIIPSLVMIGGGPGSTTRESNMLGRFGNTGSAVASVQRIRSVEYASPIWSVLSALVPRKYIQYLPSISSGTMAPDFVHPTFHLPLYAGRITPLRSQCIRSLEVARQSCASFLLYPVYVR